MSPDMEFLFSRKALCEPIQISSQMPVALSKHAYPSPRNDPSWCGVYLQQLQCCGTTPFLRVVAPTFLKNVFWTLTFLNLSELLEMSFVMVLTIYCSPKNTCRSAAVDTVDRAISLIVANGSVQLGCKSPVIVC